MSSKSNDHGRAYEYAWIKTLYQVLSKSRTVKITENSSLEANKRAWDTIDSPMQDLLMLSADSAVDTIIELEPLMTEPCDDTLYLEFQKDEEGIAGDVRDVVIKRESISWEVGLSVKHNHEAIGHNRLSKKLDFGEKWYGIPCSEDYWRSVTPIFDRLSDLKSKSVKWSELSDKSESVYVPLLNAFIEEVKCAYKTDNNLPRRMIEHLIGVKDYYKVVSMDNKRLTLIHTFNMHNTLNKSSRIKTSAVSVPVVELPSRMVALEFKPNSDNTVEMYLDNGWQLSFRIHNASTLVESSLKFDIQFISMPVSILNIECKWRRTD